MHENVLLKVFQTWNNRWESASDKNNLLTLFSYFRCLGSSKELILCILIEGKKIQLCVLKKQIFQPKNSS